ncbi:hypothetical protein ABZ725_40490 [Streptomyces sp. NPDC006872]|uniref:hypothetical protein n=1 Tax=Streptomyces sp. NPDC006872 TaxID=3155720 RepID=UPI0033D3CB62
MHIPEYAHALIRSELPTIPTSRQVGMVDCCLCNQPFEDRLPVALGPTPESGLFGCHPCLHRRVTRARRARDAALTQDAEQALAEAEAWRPARERHLVRLDRVRQAADAVAELSGGDRAEPLQLAWLLVSLESAYTWIPDAPEPPADAADEATELKEERFRLDLAMITAREAVADRLTYHLLNEAQPAEPEMCEEFECPEDCSGRHDSDHIDCGPDEIFEDLLRHGITVERPKPEPPSRHLLALLEGAGSEEKRTPNSGIVAAAPDVLADFGIDADDTDVLVSAAAVGLVAVAWREGPLDRIHAADDGPSDGEIFAQSVDLYRWARAALLAARDDGPEELLAFVAIASDLDLPWAGGSPFTLRAVSAPAPLAEFIQHVDDRVWFTTEVMREQGWRAALLHRSLTAALQAPHHFGLPGWPGAVRTAMERLAVLDRSDAPETLTDLTAVETALLEAPDELGAEALDWISRQALFE